MWRFAVESLSTRIERIGSAREFAAAVGKRFSQFVSFHQILSDRRLSDAISATIQNRDRAKHCHRLLIHVTTSSSSADVCA
jgi:hypothetical protein